MEPVGRYLAIRIHRGAMPKQKTQRCLAILLVVLVSNRRLSAGIATSPIDQTQIIDFLNESINWYQQIAVGQPESPSPNDILFAASNAPLADQVVKLSFDFGHAGADLLGQTTSGAISSASVDSRYQSLAASASKIDVQLDQTQSQLESLKQKLKSTSVRKQKDILSAIAETESKLGLLKARRGALNSVSQFMESASQPSGLLSHIEALEHSVSIGGSTSATRSAASMKQQATTRPTELLGIWSKLAAVYALSRKIKIIDDAIGNTRNLSQSARKLQIPLHERIKALSLRGDAIANRADSSDPAVLLQQRTALDALTAEFNLVAAPLIPLSKQKILLQTYQGNLEDWRAATKREYLDARKSLLLRLVFLAVIIAIVYLVFRLWRRAIFRYVPDSHRRYPYLLLRQIVLWFVIAMVVTFGFVSRLGSVATFAGLLTAGVALALQNVIIAIVGYFLLIGKFGIRTSDRVQVAGVNGEVIEIGLIRFHVMELIGVGSDVQPSGRVVAFSNAIVFQPTAALFRQIPGTDFLWHETSVTLAPDSDYIEVERRMQAALSAAFSDYRQGFEDLRRKMETKLLLVSIGPLEPKVRLVLTSAALQVFIRYPVNANNAVAIDDRINSELLHAVELEPKLKVVGVEVPTARRQPYDPATGVRGV
jgi:small-conductance mechanosensitive channel